MRDRGSQVQLICAAVAVPAALLCSAAHATDYLSVAEAQKLMFPDASAFVAKTVSIAPEQLKLIASRAGGTLNPGLWNLSAAMAGEKLLGYVIVDSVVGKFELINYAVAVSPDGEIRDVEILSYREAHGGEVRTKAWRGQFVGKSAAAPLEIGNDIANISGATLSCTHLTDGIRRIATYAQVALAKS